MTMTDIQHVHVYRVVKKWEMDVACNEGDSALKQALAAVRRGALDGQPPEREYLAIIPGADRVRELEQELEQVKQEYHDGEMAWMAKHNHASVERNIAYEERDTLRTQLADEQARRKKMRQYLDDQDLLPVEVRAELNRLESETPSETKEK